MYNFCFNEREKKRDWGFRFIKHEWKGSFVVKTSFGPVVNRLK